MPLIYGKTPSGFAEDLKEFFTKGNFYPEDSTLIKMAGLIINALKEDPLFSKVNLFMKALRAIAAFLFDQNKCIIKGYFSDSHIIYYKEEIERLCLYYKVQGKKYKSQKVSIIKPVRDNEGGFVKSKIKTVNAFIANYIHFLDGFVCHYVIEHFLCKSNLELGSIHDSFFIKPDNADTLRRVYKDGLIIAKKIHTYNLFYWLYEICNTYKKHNLNNPEIEELLKPLELFIANSKQFETDYNYELKFPPLKDIIQLLEEILTVATTTEKTRLDAIITYIKITESSNNYNLFEDLANNNGLLLFPDNG